MTAASSSMRACPIQPERNEPETNPAPWYRARALPLRASITVLLPLLVLVVLSGVITRTASAAAVFRCSNAYSDRPCPGATLLNDLDDRRSESQRAAAAKVAVREAALAARMAGTDEQLSMPTSTTRRPTSSSKRRTASTSLGAPATAQTAGNARSTGAARRRNDDPDLFVAYVPKPPKQAVARKGR